MLTALAIEHAKPRDKPYKLSDGNGLSLLVETNGSKLWRFRYHFGGKEKMLALGSFPDVALATARERRDDARKLLADGIDPSQHRKDQKLANAIAEKNTFGAIAEEYIARLEQQKKAPITVSKNRWLLLDLAASLKDRPVARITPAEILTLLRGVEGSGRRETARRLRSTISGVFRLAVATLRAENDPTYALRGALVPPVVTHRAAITDEGRFGALIQAVQDYQGAPIVRHAVLFMAYTMTRPGEVRFMRKSEVVFPRALWKIPAERMKMRRPHEVPLSRQALAILQEVWGWGEELVFPSVLSRRRALSENTFNTALRRLGYAKEEMTAHGFRSSASTILNERGFNPDWIEAALAHQDEDETRRSYNRSTYLKERVGMMQSWSDIVDDLQLTATDNAAVASTVRRA